jgi:3',5'-cyclic AMP phosphodiesterase CpdA
VDPEQLGWLRNALRDSNAPWKICYFHHPLYSDGKFHGPDTDLRARIEPIFRENGVRVVLSGHEHLYERMKPHSGIYYFVLGNSGELRRNGLKRSSDTDSSFDADRGFMVMEIAGDQLYFQTVSRTGKTVDSGVIERQGRR